MKKIMAPVFVFWIVFLCPPGASAQTGIGTTAPDSQSMLDITSSQKGLLLPRLNGSQQASLAATLTSAQAGMLISDSISGKTLCWAGKVWANASGLRLVASAPLTVSSLDTIALNPGTNKGDLITWDGNNWVNIQPATGHFTVQADNRQPYVTVNYCIALTGVFPTRNSADPFVGEIDMYAFGVVPPNYAPCNGQMLPVSQNQVLFALLGSTYGGDGINTFALPDLQGAVAMHGASLYPIGTSGGSETSTISR